MVYFKISVSPLGDWRPGRDAEPGGLVGPGHAGDDHIDVIDLLVASFRDSPRRLTPVLPVASLREADPSRIKWSQAALGGLGTLDSPTPHSGRP